MADKAHILTDEKLEQMEKRLSAIYSEAQKDIQKKADEYFEKFKAKDDEYFKKYKSHKMTKEEYKEWQHWRRRSMMTGKRFTAMKEDVAKQLLNVNQTATAYINGELPEIYTLNYNALATSVDGVGGYSFTLLDRDTVKHLATTDTSLLPFRELDPAKDIPWNMKAINSEVLQGIIQGESIPDMSKRIFGEIMKTSKTEGLTDKEMGALLKRNKDAAIRSARTIVTGAENKGRMDSYKRAQDDGIILQKEWLSSDQPGRTRNWHLSGAFKSLIVDVDKPFHNSVGDIMFPGDPSADGENLYNCRCSMAAVVKGFKKAQVEKAMEEKQVEAPQTAAFNPAKTTAEAEAYAKEHIFSGAYLGKTSYKGIDVDMANGINETLERITQKYGRKLSGIEVVNPKTAKGLKALGGSADAPFATNSLNGMVYINKDIVKNAKALKSYTDKGDEAFKLVMANKDKLSGKMRTLAEIYEKAGKDLVDSSLEGMITHEYGHYLAVAINPKADVVSKIADGMGDHLVSGYSQHNVREYLAECFTEYERGDRSKLDPIVIELFEGAIKR